MKGLHIRIKKTGFSIKPSRPQKSILELINLTDVTADHPHTRFLSEKFKSSQEE